MNSLEQAMSAALADDQPDGSDLVGTYHRFGEIGPVYEVMEPEKDGYVLVRLAESGTTARYSIEEVRKDPPA